MSSTHRTRTGLASMLPGVLILVLALGVALPACSQDKAAAKEKSMKAMPATSAAADAGQCNKVVATVAGKPITEADVQAANKNEYHQFLENGLKELVQDRMVEAEAQAKGVSKDQLMADGMKPAAVTDQDVDAFYEQNKAQIPPSTTKEQIAPRIKQYLEQQRQFEARQAFMKSLEEKYKAEYMLEPLRVEVAAVGPAKGPANAPVTIVEFSDFQCPFCSRLVPTIEQVHAKYGDKVRVVFRQFPLSIHPNAQKAAEASLCAEEQGKFWEMHDAMFKDQQGLGVDGLKAKAASIGLKAEDFNSCLDSGKYASKVAADMDAGTKVGVSGTPAMFINGRLISGAVPIDQITPVIDDELKRAGSKSAAK
jgi:protein-disulfide isomerase